MSWSDDHGLCFRAPLVRIEDAPSVMELYQKDLKQEALMELGLTRLNTQKERAGGGEGEAEQENLDARVLEADDDFPTRSGGRLPWKQRRYTFREWPLEGSLHWPPDQALLEVWRGPREVSGRMEQIQDNNRISFEMKVLIESLDLSGTYDHLNLSCFAGVERLSRRIQAIVDAFSSGPVSDTDLQRMQYPHSFIRGKNNEELELFQYRAEYRKGRKKAWL